MDGTKRSHLRKGLRVAIVLKEDQPTGKRTIGLIDAILTPSAEHHRGIKVRLADGQVGRVQEILAPLPRDPQPPATRDIFLTVVLVCSPSGLWYGRRHCDDSGEQILCLGLDREVIAGDGLPTTAHGVAEQIARSVQAVAESPHELLTASLPIDRRTVHIHFFVLTGGPLVDTEASKWNWVGWVSAQEIESAAERDLLSPETRLAVEELNKLGRLR